MTETGPGTLQEMSRRRLPRAVGTAGVGTPVARRRGALAGLAGRKLRLSCAAVGRPAAGLVGGTDGRGRAGPAPADPGHRCAAGAPPRPVGGSPPDPARPARPSRTSAAARIVLSGGHAALVAGARPR